MPGPHAFTSATMPLVLRASSIAHELLRPATSCAHDTVASTASRLTFRDDLAVTPLLPRRDGESKPQTSEKRKQNIFCKRAGQDFADPARRANQLTKTIVKYLQRSAFVSLLPQAKRAAGSRRAKLALGWREAPGGGCLRKQDHQMNARRPPPVTSFAARPMCHPPRASQNARGGGTRGTCRREFTSIQPA
jgi:hypothetical protein